MPGTTRNRKCSVATCEFKIDDASKAMCCGMCQGWFHVGCISLSQETADLIKTNSNNIIWKCDKCVFEQPSLGTLLNKIITLEKFISTKFEVFSQTITQICNDKNVQPNPNSTIAGTTPPMQTNSVIEDTSSTNNNIPQNDAVLIEQTSFTKKICNYYKRGNCRHGANGKKLIEGQGCKYQHPPKCLKFCRYGNDPDYGCPGDCSLVHPVLCKSSLYYKTCFRNDCTLAHLTGTKRSRDPGPSSNQLNNIQRHQNPLNRPPRSYNPTREDFTYRTYPNFSYSQNTNNLYSRQLYQEHPPCNPNTMLPTKNPDYYSENQVTNILKQIQVSFDSLLTNKAINSNFQPQQQPIHITNPPNHHVNNNFPFIPNNSQQTGTQTQNTYPKNYQNIAPNQQPQ